MKYRDVRKEVNTIHLITKNIWQPLFGSMYKFKFLVLRIWIHIYFILFKIFKGAWVCLPLLFDILFRKLSLFHLREGKLSKAKIEKHWIVSCRQTGILSSLKYATARALGYVEKRARKAPSKHACFFFNRPLFFLRLEGTIFFLSPLSALFLFYFETVFWIFLIFIF